MFQMIWHIQKRPIPHEIAAAKRYYSEGRSIMKAVKEGTDTTSVSCQSGVRDEEQRGSKNLLHAFSLLSQKQHKSPWTSDTLYTANITSYPEATDPEPTQHSNQHRGGPEQVFEQESVEVSESTQVILTLMDSECDSRTLPTAIILPSPTRKHISRQEELLVLDKEKLMVVSGSSASLRSIMYAITAFLLIFNHGRDVLRVREISSPAYVVQHSSGLHKHLKLLSQGNIEDIPHSYLIASRSTTT
ncbi:unnamed protein product [Boreogadus saida]